MDANTFLIKTNRTKTKRETFNIKNSMKKSELKKQLRSLQNDVDDIKKQFNVGKKSTVSEQPKEIDWSKPGQLVENEFGYTWITTGKDVDRNCFQGVLLKRPETDKTKPLGHKADSCKKVAFKLCTQPINIKND